jgi:type IV secretory pathway VirJ component
MGATCDRCRQPAETALCLGDFEYLCERCWGAGTHVCERCERVLTCCTCNGEGCTTCAMPAPSSRGRDIVTRGREHAVTLTKAAVTFLATETPEDRAALRQLAQKATPEDIGHLAVTAAWALEALATLMAVDVDWLLARMGDAADGTAA